MHSLDQKGLITRTEAVEAADKSRAHPKGQQQTQVNSQSYKMPCIEVLKKQRHLVKVSPPPKKQRARNVLDSMNSKPNFEHGSRH